MAKTKDLEAWGRSTARKRYAEGGGTDISEQSAGPDDEAPADRPSEIDAFISEVMRKQISKMRED